MPRRPNPRAQSRLALIQHLFDASAQRYEVDIAPVLAPLVADFAASVIPRISTSSLKTVLDLGTGTGLLARALAPCAQHIVGIDISGESLHVARNTPAAAHLHFVRGDIHDLPLARESFGLVAASFGLNATTPRDSLRAIHRTLTPDGLLAIQEWGPLPALDRAFSEVLEDHLSEEADLPSHRHFGEQIPQWSNQLQDLDDYHEMLGELGFVVEEALESAPVAVRLAGVDDYLRYKLAWTHRWEEHRAMTGPVRAAFYSAATARLASFAAPDGSLIWQPWVIRVLARKVARQVRWS